MATAAKSAMSLPAVKASLVLPISTAPTSASARSRASARVAYMASVRAFFFSGRFSWSERTPSLRLVRT